MKKTLLYFTILFSCTYSFGQTINADYPYGRYKMSLEGINFNLFMGKDNRFGLEIKEIEPRNDDSDPEKILIKGFYTTDKDTISFQPDPSYSQFNIQYKKSDDVEKDKIRLNITGFSYYDDDYFILVDNNSDISKSISIDSLYKTVNGEDDYDENYDKKVITLSVDKADSLYVIRKYYYRQEITAYAVPDGNEILIRKSSDKDLFSSEALKGKKGENGNEMILFTDSKRRSNIISVFFISDEVDTQMTMPTPVIADAGYNVWDKYSFRKIEQGYDSEYLEAVEAVAVAEEYQKIPEYKTDKDIQKAAADENKYIIRYYAGTAGDKCNDYSNVNSFLNQTLGSYEKMDEFNKYFVFREVSETDKSFFEKYQPGESPLTVISAPDNTFLYKESNHCLNQVINDYLCYSPEFVGNLLDRHYAATVLAPALKNEKNPSRKQAEKYLSILSQDKNADFDYFLNRVEDEENKAETTQWNTAIDTTLVVNLLNSLIKNHYSKEKPDSLTITLVKDVLSYVHRTEETDYYTTNYAYPLIENNQLAPAYEYLINICEKYPQQAEQNNVFAFVNNQVENVTNYSSDSKLKVLSYYLFARNTSLSSLEIPLLIKEYTGSESESLNLNSDIDNMIFTYLNSSIGNNIEQKTNELFEDIYKSRKKELSYVLSQTGYSDIYYDDEDIDFNNREVKSALKTAYRNMIAGQLNNVAWNNYQYVSLENPELLKQSLAWSEASLALDPENPYYLDTCARLLYRLGRRQEAIEKQEAANARLDDIDNISTRREMRDALIRMKNDTLW